MPARRGRIEARRWLGPLLLGIACDPAPAPDATSPWPSAAACNGLKEWPDAATAQEDDAHAAIDALRREGADCGQRGKLGPTPPLLRAPALDCAARWHAQDMATEGYVGRLDPDSVDEHERVEATGYRATWLVQHVAAGPRDAAQLVQQTWRPRDVPCSHLTSPDAIDIGLGMVGDVDDELGTYWVVLLASPEE